MGNSLASIANCPLENVPTHTVLRVLRGGAGWHLDRLVKKSCSITKGQRHKKQQITWRKCHIIMRRRDTQDTKIKAFSLKYHQIPKGGIILPIGVLVFMKKLVYHFFLHIFLRLFKYKVLIFGKYEFNPRNSIKFIEKHSSIQGIAVNLFKNIHAKLSLINWKV